MPPGNAACLHSWLNDYAEYDRFPVTLGGQEVTIYHAQYADYPLERAARTLYENLEFDPSEYAEYDDGLRDALFGEVDVRSIVEDDPVLDVGLHDEHLFDEGAYLDAGDLSHSVTTLATVYDDYVHDKDRAYVEGREPPETQAQFIADLLTIHNVSLAEQHIHDVRFVTYDDPWSENEALEALFAMRDLIERSHGWSTFSVPSPSEAEVEELWTIIEEMDFPKEVDLVYALYIIDEGAQRFDKRDAVDRKMRSSLGNITRSMMSPGKSAPQGMKWTAEDTSAEDLEAFIEEQREAEQQ